MAMFNKLLSVFNFSKYKTIITKRSKPENSIEYCMQFKTLQSKTT